MIAGTCEPVSPRLAFTAASGVTTAIPCTLFAAYAPATDVFIETPATLTGASADFTTAASTDGELDDEESDDEESDDEELFDEGVVDEELVDGAPDEPPLAHTIKADDITIVAVSITASAFLSFIVIPPFNLALYNQLKVYHIYLYYIA